jgi:hypothetical protein
LPCDFYSNSWGGDVWVNKYLDHWIVSNYQANRLLKSSHEIWTQIISFDFQYFHHWTIEDIYITSKITCAKTIPHSTWAFVIFELFYKTCVEIRKWQ